MAGQNRNMDLRLGATYNKCHIHRKLECVCKITSNKEKESTHRGLAFLDHNVPLNQRYRPATSYGKENHTEQNLKVIPIYANVKNKNCNSKECNTHVEKVPEVSKMNCSHSPDVDWLEKFLYISDYRNDIIEYLQKKEQEIYIPEHIVKRYGMKHIILANWLTRVQHGLGFPGHVLFIAIRVLIRAISKMDRPGIKLQLVGITAFWIATKCDSKTTAPSVDTILSTTKNAFSEKNLYDMEVQLLKVLDFDLNPEEPLIFVSYYLHVLNVEDDAVYNTCNYLLDIVYATVEHAVKCPSYLAAAAVFAALRIYGIEQLWNEKEQNEGFYPLDEIEEMSKTMLTELKIVNIFAVNGGNDAFKKYSSSRYSNLSNTLSKLR